MNSELPPDVVAAVQANRKVEAIKLLRQHQGIDLKEAKGIIDAYIAENPHAVATRSKEEGSGFGRILLTGIIAALLYGLYQLFVGPE